MALFPAWNGSQGARPPASFACQAFCFVSIRRKRQAVDKVRSAGGIIGCPIIRASLTPCCFRFARSIVAVHLRVALGLRPNSPPGRRFPPRLPGLGAASQSLMPRHFFANIASACRAQETWLSPKAWVFQRSGAPVARDGPGLGALWQSSKHKLLFLIPLVVRPAPHRRLARWSFPPSPALHTSRTACSHGKESDCADRKK